ncbi:hypothetical protein [Sphingomonas sp. C3-2]|uniref:hypothetical protein n=1 Tax=Sphingomonas sp. C3-2 TaxID=3062169 RepID=UPI00294ADC87|nr:hypothetical protein [Sphingomonas sp. C3-2]WOK36944.1 hypothetical protein QYC26_01735 [Sphingomonas sp. C3-2]
MRLLVSSVSALLALSALTTPVAALAQASAKNGVTMYSSDGKRLGKINRVADGVATIIFDSRFVRVPLSSLTDSDGKLVTSLDYAAVRKLK